MNKKRHIIVNILFILAMCACTGCSGNSEILNKKYTREELDNLAKIEIYSAKNDEPMKTVSDEDLLYQYNQHISLAFLDHFNNLDYLDSLDNSDSSDNSDSLDSSDNSDSLDSLDNSDSLDSLDNSDSSDNSDSLDSSDNSDSLDNPDIKEQNMEEYEEELEKSIEGTEEEYYFVSYKYSVARLGSQELEKNTTITLYADSNVLKMTVSEEAVKGISIPQEFLIFYYEISDEDMAFYRSLIEA